MSPTALEAPGHHDSFSLPKEVKEVKVHPSARRSPEGGLIKVESEDVVYEEGEIRAKFTDRGAAVTSKSPCCQIGHVRRLMVAQGMRTGSCMSKRPKRTTTS